MTPLHPRGMKALGGLYAYVLRCGLEKPLIDLVYLRSSQLNGCAYCIDAHAHDAIAGGASIGKLMLVSAWREAGAYFSQPRARGPGVGPKWSPGSRTPTHRTRPSWRRKKNSLTSSSPI